MKEPKMKEPKLPPEDSPLGMALIGLMVLCSSCVMAAIPLAIAAVLFALAWWLISH